MEVVNLKGRTIDDVPFSGLVERLCQISLMCESMGQSKAQFDKDDLLSIISGVMVAAVEGLAFTTATREEIAQVRKYLLSGMKLERIAPH